VDAAHRQAQSLSRVQAVRLAGDKEGGAQMNPLANLANLAVESICIGVLIPCAIALAVVALCDVSRRWRK